MNIEIIHDASKATGIAVIIDVFRAFTVEPYLVEYGAEKIIPVGDKEIAYRLKEENPEYILVGERNGVKLPGFDYGNSPFQISKGNFKGKTVVHTTSCGTQGIVRAKNASEIITGSLVNLNAIVKYIKSKNYETVSIVSMSRPGKKPDDEDELCAKYIRLLLENKKIENVEKDIEELKKGTGSKFFKDELKEVFPTEDFGLCTELNKFNFVLKVKKDLDNDSLIVEKVTV